ncbi:autotransporter outer membrane beta-barrel domain-containing protein [Methylovorus mays]|uniref:autotransporter outer membrane beta-barrel domain-containing protein n=1 Tax=Methylovorus mays TaxID=184077 RepID=UPI001E2B8A4D|nr:autotransporter outer membrane beta-barrel domain-containing protein [Methylovorus mays]MCB5207396.1 autotransporter outer membrane beta-barrel domain-containing protein [Methylovorus mays]
MALASTGPIYAITTNGGTGDVEISNSGLMYGARGTFDTSAISTIFTEVSLDPASFSSDANGNLLYAGNPAGMAAAIAVDSSVSNLVITNRYDGDDINQTPAIVALGDFSAAVFTNSANLTFNNYGLLKNISSESNSFSEGKWALASYGGATFTAPSIQDGTQFATVTSSGMTTILNHGGISGDVLVLDVNPLLAAASQANSNLTLTYSAEDVGPRNSYLENRGEWNGDIYLGSGSHVFNNYATFRGDIYVDQTAKAVTSVTGGVSSDLYWVAGDREFTLNQYGNFGSGGGTVSNSITINDVVGSVNTINWYASGQDSDPFFNLIMSGAGVNTLNLYCVESSRECLAGGDWLGLTELNIEGRAWNFRADTDGTTIDVGSGDVKFNSEVVRLGADIIARSVTVSETTTLIANLAASLDAVNEDKIGSVTGNFVNNGSLVLRDATMTVNGDATFNSGSVLSLRINSAGNGGLSISGQGTFASDSTVVVSAKDYYFRTGDTFTIATNSSGDPIIIGPGAIVNLSSSDSTGDIILTARVGIPDYLNVTTAGNNAVNVLMNYSGSDSGLVALQNEIQALGAEDLKRAAERLRPEINDSLVRMTLQHSDRVLGLVESHLFDTYLAQVKGEPRVPVDGKLPSGAGIWFQGFGGIGTQDTRNNVDGYTGTSTGMAAGMDRLVGSSDTLRAGFAGAYAYGNIDNRGYTDAHRTNINSYMGLVYGAWNADPWYVNGALGLARNTYATERIALGQSAEANHESWQFSAKVDAGWPLMVNDLLTVVPMGMLSYNRINEQGYTEKGKDYDVLNGGTYSEGQLVGTDSAINLRIGSKTYDSYRAGLGGKVLLNIQQPDYNAGVELRAQLVREFGDLTNNSVAQFTHGGPVFYSPGIRPARDTLVLGSSVRLTGSDANDQLTLLASLDAELREQYFGQAMTLMLRYDFDQGPSYEKKASYRKAAALVREQATAKHAVQATDRDIARLSQAMTAKNTDLMDEQLAADLKSTDPAVRADAEKRQAVKVAIDNWINAMLNGNSQVYFNSYAADYVNEEGLTRSQWEQKRRRELKEGANTAMHIADLTIEAEGTRASTVFTQTSLQNNQPKKVQKVLELEQRNGRWLILSEDNVPLDN